MTFFRPVFRHLKYLAPGILNVIYFIYPCAYKYDTAYEKFFYSLIFRYFLRFTQ